MRLLPSRRTHDRLILFREIYAEEVEHIVWTQIILVDFLVLLGDEGTRPRRRYQRTIW